MQQYDKNDIQNNDKNNINSKYSDTHINNNKNIMIWKRNINKSMII